MRTGSGAKIRLALAGATALTLAIPPSFGIPPSGGGGGGPLTVQDFPRDYLIYDSGPAVGQTSAAIPVSGTGPVGAVIEARAVSTALSGVGTTAWTTLAAVGGGGTYIGVLDVPLARPWLKIEVRNQVAPATVVQTVSRFAVGYVMALWGQSELARGWSTTLDRLTPQALTTIKQQVMNLANKGMCGRTSREPLNIASAGNLPPGGSLAGNVLTISGNQFISNWSFTDYEVRIPSGAVITLSQCRFIATASGTHNYMVQARVGGRAIIDDCDFQGPSAFTNLAAAIKEEQTAIGQYGKTVSTRCKFLDLPADGAKLVAGSMRWCYAKWAKNTNSAGPITAWSSTTTYSAGTHVYTAQNNVFFSAVNGNLNNPPPSTITSDAFWTSVDPHVDCVTAEKADESVFIEYSYFDLKDLVYANGGTGGNNSIRFAPVNGTSSFLNSHVRYCIFDRDATSASFPFQITPTYLGQVYMTGCWYTPRASGGNVDIYPSMQSSYRWAGMKRFSDDAARPAVEGQTDESATFVEENNDYVIQHVYHDRVGSGAAGVQYKPATAADRHTSTFAAMTNVMLLELCGYKVCFLHQTMSGTGTYETFNNGDTTRFWADDKAIHDFGTAGGGKVGIAGAQWNSATAGYGLNLSIAFYELLTQRNWTTQALMTRPFQYPTTALVQGQDTADNSLAEIYNLSQTRWTFLGPSSGTHGISKLNSLQNTGGTVQTSLLNWMRHAISHKNMMADARSVGVFAPQGIVMCNRTGQNFGGNIDYAHPATGVIDGSPQFLCQALHGLMQSAGLRKWRVPELDQIYWEPSGAYVEIWSTAGDVTTNRKIRGMADLPPTYPHWTDCWGFEWCVGNPDLNNGNGLIPILSALLVNADGSGTPAAAGRIRMVKPGGGTWAVGDTVVYGLGAASGSLVHPEDNDNEGWANRPVIEVGAIGAHLGQFGMPMRSLPQWTRP